ncbi:MAG: ABC transporter permease, partial [Acidimicrobiales bacterium]
GGLGGSVGVMLFRAWGFPWPLSIVVGVVAGLVVGVLVERVVIRRFFNSPRLVLTVATIGLAQILGGAATGLPTLFGQDPVVPSFSTPLSDLNFEVFPLIISGNELLMLAAVPVILAALSWLLLRTEYGMAIRAIAENADRAMLLGIPIRRLSTLVWAVIGGLAALTVMLRAPVEGMTIDAAAGPTILLGPLAAAIVARMTSLPVAFAAGVGLGVIERIVAWNLRQQSTNSVVFLAVILIALLAQRGRESRAEAADESTWASAGFGRRLPDAVRSLTEVRVVRVLVPAGVAAVALWFGTTAGPANLNRVSTALLFAIVALSLVVLTGWSGTVSLGQYAVVGVGGVTAANLLAKQNLDLFVTLLLSAAAGAAVAVVVGLPALRVKGMFLAVTTLAFAVAVNNFFLDPRNFPGWIPGDYDRPVLWKHIDLFGEQAMFFLILTFLVLTIFVARAMRGTHPGRTLIATRDNPRAAAAMAVPVVRNRITGFVVAGVIAGVAGALHATLLTGVGFGTYPPSSSLLVFSMTVIGGISSITGSLLGVGLVQLISFWFPAVELVITGALVLVVLYFFPGGVGQFVDMARDKIYRRLAARRGIELKETFADGTVDAEPLQTGGSYGRGSAAE